MPGKIKVNRNFDKNKKSHFSSSYNMKKNGLNVLGIRSFLKFHSHRKPLRSHGTSTKNYQVIYKGLKLHSTAIIRNTVLYVVKS